MIYKNPSLSASKSREGRTFEGEGIMKVNPPPTASEKQPGGYY
jgi:hypothetical protein